MLRSPARGSPTARLSAGPLGTISEEHKYEGPAGRANKDSVSVLVLDHEILQCTDRKKSWIKASIGVAMIMFVANLVVLVALVQKETVPYAAVSTIDGPTGGMSSAHRRLPSDYRAINKCPGGEATLTSFASKSKVPKVKSEHQIAFVTGGYEKISKGSGDFKAVGPITMFLSKVQHDDGIYGSVGEVGVHHGRFTGALFVTARETEKLIAADLFEDLQYQNVDVSGFGNKQAFLKGLKTYGLGESDLHLIYTGSTEDIPFDWSQREGFEPFRMLSVDAGHTAALTYNDLQVAACNAVRGSVIILDDFFHNLWPGVTEGFFQFAAYGPVDGVYPFLRCEGKAFFTNDATMHEVYYEKLRTDMKFKHLLNRYAHNVRGSKVKYMMNGVPYLKCETSKLTKVTTHMLWKSVVY